MSQNTMTGTMGVDLPKDVYVLHDFLAALLYSYPNKKSGKRVYHSIGLGKFGLDLQKGRQVTVNQTTGKIMATPPPFVYKLTIEELEQAAVKLPKLVQVVKMGNMYNWSPEKVVEEANKIEFVSSPNEPTLWQLNNQDSSTDLFAQTEPRMTGNSGFDSPSGWPMTSFRGPLDSDRVWGENTFGTPL